MFLLRNSDTWKSKICKSFAQSLFNCGRPGRKYSFVILLKVKEIINYYAWILQKLDARQTKKFHSLCKIWKQTKAAHMQIANKIIEAWQHWQRFIHHFLSICLKNFESYTQIFIADLLSRSLTSKFSLLMYALISNPSQKSAIQYSHTKASSWNPTFVVNHYVKPNGNIFALNTLYKNRNKLKLKSNIKTMVGFSCYSA